MENQFLNLEELSVNPEFMKLVNPAYSTGKMTLYQLAATGDPLAVKFMQKMNVGEDSQALEAGAKIPEDILKMNFTILESRYRTVMNYAEQKNAKVFIDLPCGYTPRAIELADKGMEYYGLDLPIVIDELKGIMDAAADSEQKPHIHLGAVDATNYESLVNALSDVRGEVCISTEGLLMYMTDTETEAIVENIAKLLHKFGGAWITTDPTEGHRYFCCAKAFFGDQGWDIMMRMREIVAKKSDFNVGKNSFCDVNKQEYAEALLKKHHLKLTRVPNETLLHDLNMFRQLSDAQIQGFNEAMKAVPVWVIEPSKQVTIEPVEEESFGIQAEVCDGTLSLKLRGRVDTITAPKLLAFYEKTIADNDITAIDIDCGSLAYISSAGLRVIMLMKRRIDSISLHHVNSTVREIFEQTGFAEFLSID